MSKPSTRQGLIDYCLRKLGYPVLEINVDDDQLSKLIRPEDISYSSSKDSNYKLNTYSSFLFEGNKFKIKTVSKYNGYIKNIGMAKMVITLLSYK